MEDFYNETYISREGEDISDDLLNVLWSFTVASFAVGGMIGGILGAWWADKFGRYRRGLMPMWCFVACIYYRELCNQGICDFPKHFQRISEIPKWTRESQIQ